jgi:hypothetical protein
MVQKIPPPPPLAVRDQTLNRWLLELTAILNSQGQIDGSNISVFVGDSGFGGVAGVVPAPAIGSGATDAVLKASGIFGVVGWTNVRLSKTGTYAVANADKGKTIALGGNAFYALSFGAASGFDADFVVLIVNEDAGRAKSIALSGGATFTLWPGQSVIIFNDNNTWQTFGRSRWLLTGNVTLYCDVVNGNDANDGLAAGAGGAFKTVQRAGDVVMDYIDIGGTYSITIQLADGTYPESVALGAYVGRGRQSHTGPVLITGNALTPSNVIIQPASGAAFTVVESYFEWEFSNLKVISTAQGFYADRGAWIVLTGGIVFGACVQHMQANNGGLIEIYGDYTIVDDATYHMLAGLGGEILYLPGLTITLTGTPAFSGAFVYSQTNAIVEATGVTWTGGTTGVRFINLLGGGIDTGGGGANYFPGDSAGSTTAPGWYN